MSLSQQQEDEVVTTSNSNKIIYNKEKHQESFIKALNDFITNSRKNSIIFNKNKYDDLVNCLVEQNKNSKLKIFIAKHNLQLLTYQKQEWLKCW